MRGNNKGQANFRSNAEMSSLHVSRYRSGAAMKSHKRVTGIRRGWLPDTLPPISASREQAEVPRNRDRKPWETLNG